MWVGGCVMQHGKRERERERASKQVVSKLHYMNEHLCRAHDATDNRVFCKMFCASLHGLYVFEGYNMNLTQRNATSCEIYSQFHVSHIMCIKWRNALFSILGIKEKQQPDDLAGTDDLTGFSFQNQQPMVQCKKASL